MAQAYIVYFVLLGIMVILSRIGNYRPSYGSFSENTSFFLVSSISILLYTLVVGLRYNVGGDYLGYKEDYIEFVNLNIPYSESRYDGGYFVLMFLLKRFGLNYPFLFTSMAFLQILFFYLWARRYKFLLSWLVFFYFTSLFLFESMNIMRQALSFLIVLLSINYIQTKEKWKPFVLLLLASSFHKSAIIFLPFYFFLSFDFSKSRLFQIVLLIGAYGFVDVLFDVFFKRVELVAILLDYQSYTITDRSDLYLERDVIGLGLGVYFVLVIDFILILYSSRLKVYFKTRNLVPLYNVFYIGALLTPLSSISNSIVVQRFGFYFFSFRFVVLSFLVYYLFSDKTILLNKFIGVIIVCAFLCWFIFAIYKGAAWCSPFQFIFQD